MMNKPPLPFTKKMRLGNMPQIRIVVDKELERVWSGNATPKQAMDNAWRTVISCCVVLSNLHIKRRLPRHCLS